MMRKIIVLFIAIVFAGINAQAQGCAEPSSDEGINVFGFLQAQYDYNMFEEPESTFGFNRARIGVMGNIPYDFSYYVLLETSPFKKDGPKAYLLDAFITYSRYSFAKISVGSFKNPFGLELNTPCHALHTINRSKVVSELTAPDRDMGLMLMGGSDTTLLRYAVSYMNGTGLLVKDADTFKDFIGRVLIQPTSWMHVGGSFKAEENANNYLIELKGKGFEPFALGKRGNFYIIGIGKYNTEKEALEAKRKFMDDNPKSGLWVMKDK